MKTIDKIVLSVANDLIENGVNLNGYELIVTIEKQPLTEYIHKEYEETKKRLIALRNALNGIGVDGMGGRCEQIHKDERFIFTSEHLTPEEQCKAILNTLEEPYRTQALKNFDSEYFNSSTEYVDNKNSAIINAFDWNRTEQGCDYWAEYHDKLMDKGE